jgi:TPR repeat protein
VFRFDHLRSHILAMLGLPAAQLARASELAGQHAYQAAFGLFKKAAKAGLPAAWYQVGRAYLLGRGVPSSFSSALRWLTRAAEANEVEAQTLLASLALQGTCDPTHMNLFETTSTATDQHPNYRIALHWAEQAAAHGSAEAQAILGYVLTSGPPELRDCERGEQYYRHAAEAGCAQGQLAWALVLLRRNTLDAAREARDLLEKAAATGLPGVQFMLGVIAESGVAGTQDFTAATNHYRIAAEAEHRTAQLRYGMALLIGRGVDADPFKGESWLRRAALAGESQAAAIVGDLYACPGELPPNYIEAAMWLRRAAEAGHAGAAKTLGHLLLGDAGLTPDPEEAARWLRLAISAGDIDARNDLARLALAGQVPKADQQTTWRWFQEEAEAGNLAAAFDLGLCFAEGIGIPRDDAQALVWFERAAVAIPVAQYWCGRMRGEGRGCQPDAQASRARFLRAAELGNADAEVAAGEMLINGRGGPSDTDVAMALFKRAAASGHPGALFALDVLSRAAAPAAAAA